jgi:hypothetical protein
MIFRITFTRRPHFHWLSLQNGLNSLSHSELIYDVFGGYYRFVFSDFVIEEFLSDDANLDQFRIGIGYISAPERQEALL